MKICCYIISRQILEDGKQKRCGGKGEKLNTNERSKMRCVKWFYTWCSHFTCWGTIPLCRKTLCCTKSVTYKLYPQFVTMRDYNGRQVFTTVFSKRWRNFISSISRMILEKNLESKRETMRKVNKSKILGFFQAWERLILLFIFHSNTATKYWRSPATCSKKSYHKHLLAGYVHSHLSSVCRVCQYNVSQVDLMLQRQDFLYILQGHNHRCNQR